MPIEHDLNEQNVTKNVLGCRDVAVVRASTRLPPTEVTTSEDLKSGDFFHPGNANPLPPPPKKKEKKSAPTHPPAAPSEYKDIGIIYRH